MQFKELNIEMDILSMIDKLGFHEPTPIQEQTIPVALKGLDVIGQAQTGTGKTAAFGIPLIQKINPSLQETQGIVLAPTRELAKQVAATLQSLGTRKKIDVAIVYGGQSYDPQIRALKRKPHIVVGTPGRMIDHLKRKTLCLENVHTVVLDEADEMLSMDFIEDIENILTTVPENHQTLLFSATIPENFTQKMMKDPVIVSIKRTSLTADTIDQYCILTKESKKFALLHRLFLLHQPKKSIVFGRTKQRVMELTEALLSRGFRVDELHGDLTQARREKSLARFKNNNIQVLVATDVAARGLDITGVSHIYNFDVPEHVDSYVHRIGRTGRAGESGIAITFVTPSEEDVIHEYEKFIAKKMIWMEAPSEEELRKKQLEEVIEQFEKSLEKESREIYQQAAKSFIYQYSPEQLVSTALKLLMPEMNSNPIQLSPVAPLRRKQKRKSRSHSNKDFSSKRDNGRRNDRRRRDGKKADYSSKRTRPQKNRKRSSRHA